MEQLYKSRTGFCITIYIKKVNLFAHPHLYLPNINMSAGYRLILTILLFVETVFFHYLIRNPLIVQLEVLPHISSCWSGFLTLQKDLYIALPKKHKKENYVQHSVLVGNGIINLNWTETYGIQYPQLHVCCKQCAKPGIYNELHKNRSSMGQIYDG